jgi:hypothetical protein
MDPERLKSWLDGNKAAPVAENGECMSKSAAAERHFYV